MAYSRTTWENSPSTNTPISAENLNNIEQGIIDVENEIISVGGTVSVVGGSVTAIAGTAGTAVNITATQGSVAATQGSVAAIAGTAGTAYNLTSTYGSVSSHVSATTSVHGITDTANLVYTNNATLGSVATLSTALTATQGSVTAINSSLGSVAGTVTTLNTDSRFNPPGVILPYAGSAAPTGYLMCDGTSYGTAAYAALFAAIGYAFGGSGTAFNLPDLRGRMPVGKGTHADVDQLNDNDGATLANRRPKHQHTVYDPGHSHAQTFYTYQAGGGQFPQYINNSSASTLTNTSTQTASTGIKVNPGGVASDTTSPQDTPSYIVVNYIIKT